MPKMDIGVGDMGFILWLTSSPCDKDLGERHRTQCPSCYAVVVFLSFFLTMERKT